MNIAKHPPAMSYRIDGDPPTVHWAEDGLHITADDLFQPKQSGEPSKREEAEGFLREFLGEGGKLATEVTDAATDRGITEGTLRRARESLGIKPKKQSDGTWIWSLPDARPP